MKRVNFHLTSQQIAALRKLSSDTGLSSAELIRRAVDAMLNGQKGALSVQWTMKEPHGKKERQVATAANL